MACPDHNWGENDVLVVSAWVHKVGLNLGGLVLAYTYSVRELSSQRLHTMAIKQMHVTKAVGSSPV